MKTFKMLSVEVMQDDGVLPFPLYDGIIINQENSHRLWVLELFIDAKHKDIMEKWKAANAVLTARVVISYPGNEPALFLVSVEDWRQIGDRISVLMKGRLKRARSKYAEHLLAELLDEGLEGDELLERFETGMWDRPKLKRDFTPDEKMKM
ncbi:YwpF family protein [Sporosarcina sp. GW1-11]|uniref:YwpF family protein n=1 Tax=Sporosarcina sp. GW1-11 TaxID=2899126 RepID=UPI00294F8F4F|nr:YwpF family protein [Sporosarcina sp. GW1-11]MDV6378247.1 YwpF family protein [Sporosarcina sp. GW1-11]